MTIIEPDRAVAAASTTPPDSQRIRWLVAALVALAGVSVALAFLATNSDHSSAQNNQASRQTVSLLEQRNAAVNSGKGASAAALYTPDAILEEMEGKPWAGGVTYKFVGREAIAKRLQDLSAVGLLIRPAGHIVQIGDLVSEPVKFLQRNGPGYGEGVLVFEVTQGQIAHQWMIGWVNSG